MFQFVEELWWLYLAFTAALAWLAFASHPTARGLRTAIADTLAL